MEVVTLPVFRDERGTLCAPDVPFEVKRAFYIYGADDKWRGGHAHKTQHQFLIALHGRVFVYTDGDGFALASPNHGLHVPPLNRIVLICDDNAILLVLTSGPYDEEDYIR